MSTVASILLADAAEALRREVSMLKGRADQDEAFAAWVLHRPSAVDPRDAAEAATTCPAGARTYRHVAALAYARAAGIDEAAVVQALRAGLVWLAGRETKMNDGPAGFCFDGVAVLGAALGAQHLPEPNIQRAIADWLSKFLPASLMSTRIPPWQNSLFVGAAKVLGLDSVPSDVNPAAADVRVALRARGVLPSGLDRVREEADAQAALALVKSITPVEGAAAALRLAALDWIEKTTPVIDIRHPTIVEVGDLLRRIPAAMRRWPWEDKPKTANPGVARRWEIDHEYHVQSLLYFLLVPIFPDLLDEVYLEQFGQKKPRADICIPTLRLVIEVKFVRPAKSFSEIIDEVAADASLYLSQSKDYRQVIVFVWDDSHRNHEHDLAVQGLKKINGVVDAVIVSRPGSFT